MANDVQINVKVNDQASAPMKNIANANAEAMKKMRQDIAENYRQIDAAKLGERLAKSMQGSSNFGLGSQNGQLTAQIGLQKERISLLNKTLETAKKEYGDTSKEASKYAASLQKANIALADLENRKAENIAQINRNTIGADVKKVDMSKLGMDNMVADRNLQLSGLKPESVEYYNKAISTLSPIITRQKQIVEQANQAHQTAVKLYGAESEQALKRAASLISERQGYQNLTKELTNLNKSKTALTKGGWENAIMGGALASAAYMKKALQKAVNSIETQNRLNVILGPDATNSRAWANQFAKPVGVSPTAAMNNAASIFNILNATTMDRKTALQEAQNLTQRAYDMSSLYHMPVDEVMGKIISGINGMARPLQELGININETNVKNHAVQEGIATAGQDLSEVQKIQARISYIKKYSEQADGDLENTKNSPANLQRRVETQENMLMTSMGKALVPRYAEVLGGMNGLLEIVNSSNSAVKSFANSSMILATESLAIAGAFKALKFVIPTGFHGALGGLTQVGLALAVAKEVGEELKRLSVEKNTYNPNAETVTNMFGQRMVKTEDNSILPVKLWNGMRSFFGVDTIETKLGISSLYNSLGIKTLYRDATPEEQKTQKLYETFKAEERQKMIEEDKKSGSKEKMFKASNGEVDEHELEIRVKRKLDPEFNKQMEKQEAKEADDAANKEKQRQDEERQRRLATEKQVQSELFNLQHQGAYATAQDQMLITIYSLKEKQEAAAKIIGQEDAAKYYDKIRAETTRIENDRIRKMTEDAYGSIYEITHSTIEKQLHDIEKKKEENLRAGMAEVDAVKIAETEKKNVINQAREELIGMSVKVDPNINEYQKQYYDLMTEKLNMEQKFGRESAEIARLYEKKKTQLAVDETKRRIDAVRGLTSGAFGGVTGRAKQLEADWKEKQKTNTGSGSGMPDFLGQALEEQKKEQREEAELLRELLKRTNISPMDQNLDKKIELANRNPYVDGMFNMRSDKLVYGQESFDLTGMTMGIDRVIEAIKAQRDALKAEVTVRVTFDEEGNARLKNAIAGDIANLITLGGA